MKLQQKVVQLPCHSQHQVKGGKWNQIQSHQQSLKSPSPKNGKELRMETAIIVYIHNVTELKKIK